MTALVDDIPPKMIISVPVQTTVPYLRPMKPPGGAAMGYQPVVLVHAPAPVQVSGEVQVPPVSVPPQPSDAVPHTRPPGQLVAGTQTHAPDASQLFPPGHPPPRVPHVIVPVHPAGTVPQILAPHEPVGMHAQVFVVVLHAKPVPHVPQSSVPPQPFG